MEDRSWYLVKFQKSNRIERKFEWTILSAAQAGLAQPYHGIINQQKTPSFIC